MTQNFLPHLMTPTVAPRPNWTDFASCVIDRLIGHYSDRKPSDAGSGLGWAADHLPTMEAALSGNPDTAQRFDNEYLAALGVELEPPTEESPPVRKVSVPLRVLSVALRLAATFGTAEAFKDCLRPGRVTLIEGFSGEDLDAVSSALDHGLAPPGWRLSATLPGRDDRQVASIVKPDVFEGEVTRHGAKVFLRKLDEGLEGTAGLIVLCPTDASLPASWRAGLPAPLLFAHITQDVLMVQFRCSHPFGDLDEPAIRATLPSDRVLATLQYPALRLAHREGSALASAIRLSELTRPSQNEGLRLRELVGLGPAKDIALGVIEDLAAWKRGDLPWQHVSRGLLLCGAPGTGKTELARCMAREDGLTFVSGSYSSWQKEGHLGDFLSAMNKSFATAIAGAPSVLFIDELDAFGSRSQNQVTHGASYASKCIAGLLELLDGVAGREGVVVIAATNHADNIDPALVRSGRFDQRIHIGLPSRADLAVIFRQHLRSDLPHADLGRLAALAIGRSGADVASAVRSSRGRARQHRRDFTEADLVEELSPTGSDQLPAVRWRAAVHEAGHAILIHALGTGRPICLRLNSDGGVCLAEMEGALMTSEERHQSRMVHLAGRAAERVIFGDVSAGAGGPIDSDLASATLSSLREETTLGLGTIGSLWLTADPTAMDILRLPPATQRQISQHLVDAEHDAGEVLQINKTVLNDLAIALDKAMLVEGVILQGFLDRVIPRRARESKLPKIKVNNTSERDIAAPRSVERPEDVFGAAGDAVTGPASRTARYRLQDEGQAVAVPVSNP